MLEELERALNKRDTKFIDKFIYSRLSKVEKCILETIIALGGAVDLWLLKETVKSYCSLADRDLDDYLDRINNNIHKIHVSSSEDTVRIINELPFFIDNKSTIVIINEFGKYSWLYDFIQKHKWKLILNSSIKALEIIIENKSKPITSGPAKRLLDVLALHCTPEQCNETFIKKALQRLLPSLRYHLLSTLNTGILAPMHLSLLEGIERDYIALTSRYKDLFLKEPGLLADLLILLIAWERTALTGTNPPLLLRNYKPDISHRIELLSHALDNISTSINALYNQDDQESKVQYKLLRFVSCNLTTQIIIDGISSVFLRGCKRDDPAAKVPLTAAKMWKSLGCKAYGVYYPEFDNLTNKLTELDLKQAPVDPATVFRSLLTWKQYLAFIGSHSPLLNPSSLTLASTLYNAIAKGQEPELVIEMLKPSICTPVENLTRSEKGLSLRSKICGKPAMNEKGEAIIVGEDLHPVLDDHKIVKCISRGEIHPGESIKILLGRIALFYCKLIDVLKNEPPDDWDLMVKEFIIYAFIALVTFHPIMAADLMIVALTGYLAGLAAGTHYSESTVNSLADIANSVLSYLEILEPHGFQVAGRISAIRFLLGSSGLDNRGRFVEFAGFYLPGKHVEESEIPLPNLTTGEVIRIVAYAYDKAYRDFSKCSGE